MKHEVSVYAAIDAKGELLTDKDRWNDYPQYLISYDKQVLVRLINGDSGSDLDETGRPKNPWTSEEHPELGYQEGYRVVPIKLLWEG